MNGKNKKQLAMKVTQSLQDMSPQQYLSQARHKKHNVEYYGTYIVLSC
jgi:hypothetical protein